MIYMVLAPCCELTRRKYMNREEFCRLHWRYYLVLERDFLDIERYITFDLGDNYSYDNQMITDIANSNAFSNELIKQYQTICSEVDVILKSICKELGNNNANSMTVYTEEVLKKWDLLPNQKVRMNAIELQPFLNWRSEPNYNSPDWWTPYNGVKHERLANFRNANLKNVVNALAGLYILELWFVKFIGDRDKDVDVPDDVSKLFEMVDFETINTVVGRNAYLATAQDIDSILQGNFDT